MFWKKKEREHTEKNKEQSYQRGEGDGWVDIYLSDAQ